MKRFLRSLTYALNGIIIHWKKGGNFRIQICIGFLVILAAILLKISPVEWLVVLGLIGVVLALETVNSAMEELCNFTSEEPNEAIKRIKDMSASAVLIISIFAAAVGMIIFLPRILALLS